MSLRDLGTRVMSRSLRSLGTLPGTSAAWDGMREKKIFGVGVGLYQRDYKTLCIVLISYNTRGYYKFVEYHKIL